MPVSACPAVLPGSGGLKMGWKFFKEFDVRSQCDTAKNALKKIVTQHRVFRRLACQGRFKSINVINSLARVGAFLKQILIDVGDRRRIGVNTAGAGKGSLKQGALMIGGQRRGYARLHNGIAF